MAKEIALFHLLLYAVAVNYFYQKKANLYFSDNAYYSTKEVAYKSKETVYKYTLNKELKSKYNPKFIE